jgi:hypothetical protein
MLIRLSLLLGLAVLPLACGSSSSDDDSGDDDGMATADAGPTTADAAPHTVDAGSMTGPDAAPSVASIALTFSGGCAASFAGRDIVVVANSGSIAISTVDQPFLSLQLDLHSTTHGSIALSGQERVDTGDVVNLTAAHDTWTNLSSDTVDPIGGTVTVDHYEEQAGIIDLTFHDATLQAVEAHTLCTINGRLQTFGTSF